MVYDTINASPTIMRPNGTFGFGHIIHDRSFGRFLDGAEQEISRVQSSADLFPPADTGENIIHLSTLPWLNFTSVSHARMYSIPDSVPKISFGRITDIDGQKIMPVSIHVHHALVDGMHVGQYVQAFQDLLNMGL
jgi:chloramphenicol O-acetyltransferase type A